MKKYTLVILTFVLALFLIGCSDKINGVKEAVSGIDSAADKAAKAMSLDSHSIRAIEIEYNDHFFTVNDLFKTILRDVQWNYEQLDDVHIFRVKGTWKNSLFESYQFSEEMKGKLAESGKVIVELELINGKIATEATKVTMQLNDEVLVDESGEDALHRLYEDYISQK